MNIRHTIFLYAADIHAEEQSEEEEESLSEMYYSLDDAMRECQRLSASNVAENVFCSSVRPLPLVCHCRLAPFAL